MNCISPINLPLSADGKRRRLVPCGKCRPCLQKKRNDWVFRINQECKRSTSIHFITLTYNNACVPRDYNDNMCVYKKDVQDWLKRLRKLISPSKIRYFLVSEYGGQTSRPHYHLILFNFPQLDYDITKVIRQTWQRGHVRVDPINQARINYVTKYCFQNPELDELLIPNFMLCSRKPAIGSNYMSEAVVDYHKKNLDTTVKLNGFTQRLPKYYQDRIFSEDEKFDIKIERRSYSQKQFEKYEEKYGLYDIKAINEGLPTMETQIRIREVERRAREFKKDNL